MEVKYDTVHIVRAAEKIAAGKYDAWMLLRPLWFEIGICDGKEEYDSNAARFTAAQRKALAWIRYNNEVFDGGHRQFLINSVGIVWRDALECMEMIGAVKSANRLRKIAAAFGGEIPYEKAERKAAFDELWNRENRLPRRSSEAGITVRRKRKNNRDIGFPNRDLTEAALIGAAFLRLTEY